MSDEFRYYILDTRSMVGNCALWWKPEGAGYTCQLHEAGKFTLEQTRTGRPTDVGVPCCMADALAHHHVRFDDAMAYVRERAADQVWHTRETQSGGSQPGCRPATSLTTPRAQEARNDG